VSHGTHACTSSASLASFHEGGRAAPNAAPLQHRTTSAMINLQYALMSVVAGVAGVVAGGVAGGAAAVAGVVDVHYALVSASFTLFTCPVYCQQRLEQRLT